MDGMDGEPCSVAELRFLFMDNRQILASLEENSNMKKNKDGEVKGRAAWCCEESTWKDLCLVMSVDIRGSKEHQNDPLSHSFWPTPLGPSTNTSPAEKQHPPRQKKKKKKLQLINSESALNDSYTLLRELETLALFRSRPLSVYAARRSRGI